MSPVYGSFNPTSNSVAYLNDFNQKLSYLLASDIIMGLIVELATVFYFRAVLFKEAKNFSLKALGPIEYCCVLGAIFSVICIVVGPMLRMEFDFFNNLTGPSILVCQSLVCLSIVNSVEDVKNTYTAGSAQNRITAQSASMNSTSKSQK